MRAQSCLTLCDPVDCSLQAPLSMGFSRQQQWDGLPFPPLQGIFLNQKSNLHLLHWQVDSLPLSHPGSLPHFIFTELTTAMSKMSTMLGELHTQTNPLEGLAL